MRREIPRLISVMLAILMMLSIAPAALAATTKPIDRDVQPALQEVYKDYFLLGNIYDDGDLDNTDRGNMYSYHYNVLTAQNYMKPNNLSSGGSGAAPNWTNLGRADRLMNEAYAKGIKVHGHVLVWHNQSPNWLHDAGAATRAKAKANMELYIKTVLEHYDDPKWGDTLISWDVVNEAFQDELPTVPEGAYWRDYLRTSSNWLRAYRNGADADAGERDGDHIYDAFVLARKYSDTVLYYNDFNMYEDGKSKMVAQMVKELNAQYKEEYPDDPRQLIEGVGMQSHNYIQDTPAYKVEQGINNLLEADVILSMSELDLFCFYPWNAEPQGSNGTYIDLNKRTASQLVGSNGTPEQKNYWADRGVTTGAEVEKIQAELYAEYFQVYKKYAEHIERVTFWGLLDSNSWRSRHNPLLWNSDYSTKEAFWAVADPDGYLGTTRASELKLSVNKTLVSKGEYFDVTAALASADNSNAASLSFTFDPDKFQYRGFDPAEGVSVLNTVFDNEAGKVTFMLGDLSGYNLTGLGMAMFSAREDVDLKNEDSTIGASVDYVTLQNDEKSVLSSAASLALGTVGVPGDTTGDGTVTLIDLSNVIDWFGAKAGDESWSKAKYFDFNGNGEIDIQDISKVASLIK